MYRIRDMKLEDIRSVADIESRLFSDGWSEASLSSSLAQSNVKILVAELEDTGDIVGYHIFYTSMDEGDVARIAVIPERQRMGIGDCLLEHIWEYCKEVDISRVLLEVRSSNANAIGLYEKHGFVALGIRKDYYQNSLEDGVIMEKQIDITTSN